MPDGETDGGAQLTPDLPDPASQTCPGMVGFPSTFSAAEQFTVQVSDFDRDGFDDLVFTDFSRIGLYRARGDGTFERRILVEDIDPQGFEIADLNSDGAPDLVIRNRLDTLDIESRVYLNDGNGGAADFQLLALDVTPGFQLTDVDGDDDADLVQLEAGEVVVMRQTSAGFTSREVFSPEVGDYRSFEIADVSGDGHPDIIALGATIDVFLNGGAGSFSIDPVSHPLGFTSLIALADIDGDGALDLVGGGLDSNNAGEVTVRRNLGGGSFAAPTSFAVNDGLPQALAAADMNGDGFGDVAVAVQTGDQQLQILLGTGNGALGAATKLAHEQPAVIAFGDTDGDGRPDLVAGGVATTVFRNTGDAFPYESRSEDPLGVTANLQLAPVFVDVDQDGLGDLVELLDHGSATRTLMIRRGDGVSFGAPTELDVGNGLLALAVADLDNDHRFDLVAYGPGGWISLINTGGSFSATPRVDDLSSLLELGDVDGDGRRDIVYGHWNLVSNTSTLRFRPGLGDGTFGAATTLWSGSGLSGIAVSDFNRDGTADIAISIASSTTVEHQVMLSTGAGTFVTSSTSSPQLPLQLVAKDLNGDGNPDLVALDQARMKAVLGHGDGTFGSAIESLERIGVGVETTDARSFADFDGDGILDLSARTKHTIAVAFGRGDGSFGGVQEFHADNAGSDAFAIGDVDGDGRLDLIAPLARSRVSVLPGRCW